jgi:FKBP-type peptidyl-prolyl cis-trans isomerase 2
MYKMMRIGKNRVVSIRYIMKNSEGLVLENTMNSQPVSYLHGVTGIQPLLQSQLEGFGTGDKATVLLNAASGLTEEDFIFEVIIDQVRDALPEEMILGYPVAVNVQPCEADCDCYKTIS